MSRIDMELWTPFIKHWSEAADAGLTPDELAELLGVHVGTLRSRQIALRNRGIMLPLLRGQRGPTGPHAKKKRQPAIEAACEAPKRFAESMVIYVM